MKDYLYKGFTLIELLIVMAILGVLAVVVLVAINPVQQLARTRDAGRKSAITQVGHALEAFATTHEGSYLSATNCDLEPAPGGDGNLDENWIECLVAAGELSKAPSEITNTLTPADVCSAAQIQNEICYVDNGLGTEVVVYTTLESDSERSKCADPVNDTAYFVWSTADGRGGLVCQNGSEPGAGAQTWAE